ncbi:MAG: hypothetical protein GWN67_29215 [Phycisphaerae bacterium]|nr:hypothetical protein [Phycisphaerae bacterium]NIR62671.1 hypothetical protein [candidate division Zixibacteria bacterium]NIP51985.1 hypothetical protein [Phycisphaerae bacterium]NIS54810.1 hypothetical protein [Phycisphaerae bacterium]NIU10745.1 hypothetical protein [Phycisphaerae bacterium]
MKFIERNSNQVGKITILVMVFLCVNTAVALLDGSGTQEDPWLIQSLDDFNDFAADANYWAGFTRLETDVNLAGKTYTTAVISLDTDNTNYTFEGNPFLGIFDGAGHRINNLTIDDGGVGNDYLGLFGYTENGQINNLSVENITIKVVEESYFTGGLAGFNDTTTVTNCYVSGEISAVRYSRVIGGMIGRNIDGEIANCSTANNVYPGEHTTEVGGLIGSNVNGVITNCYTTGAVSGEYMSNELGGLIGRCNDGTITDCYTTGNVSGYMQLGGLVGHNVDNIVTNCYATGTLTGGVWGIGGLIGENAYAQINNCSAVGAIFGEHYSTRLGGLIGYNNGSAGGGTVMNCFATGTVTGGDFSEILGGLIGDNVYATTINSYATGAVISGDSSGLIGGLVGENHYSNINDCYTKASVVSGDNSDSIGGLVGYNRYSIYQEIGVIRNCYAISEVLVGNNSQNIGGFAGYINNIEHINGVWNIETSGLIDGVGNQNPDPAGVTGKTTAEMHQQSTFTNWDFINVWNIGENQTYPYLRVYLPSDINKDGIVNFLDLSITANQWIQEQ